MKNLSSLGVLVALLAGVQPAEAMTIDLSTQADVYFSSPSSPDHVSAILKGTSCSDAVFTFSVQRDGVQLFKREVPMSQILSCDWVVGQPDQAQWATLHILNGAVAVVRACDRGCSGPRPIGCWVAPIFERLQKANAPLMCFTTGSEASACVAYDPETHSVIEVRRYSE